MAQLLLEGADAVETQTLWTDEVEIDGRAARIYVPSPAERRLLDQIHAVQLPAPVEDAAQIRRAYKRHIRLLHSYNEIKDVVQAMLGRLAHHRGCTTAQLYPSYALDLDD